MTTDKAFSVQLEKWLKGPGKKTYGDLETVFGIKSFAVIILLLMLPSALPIPTGGITNIFELFNIVVAIQMIAGRKSLWLPAKIKNRAIGHGLKSKALPKITSFIRWFEVRSKPRLAALLADRWFLRAVGLCVFVFTLGAGLAVPFSGLDTLPSMGAVVIALSLLLEDAALFIAGFCIGSTGIFLELALGNVALNFFR